MAQLSKEQMYPLIEAWESGDQAKGSFCNEHQLKVHTFNYWLRKYQMSAGKEKLSKPGNKFVSLQLESRPNLASPQKLELCYPNGVRVHIEGLTSVSYLEQLIRISL